ncbi:hypothetical protein [Ferrovibrio sp.]|uniref:hypothetical protein n=1 Tax=Ferrovibrio sp. TaxID=1917215 RepID=UPI0035B2A29B
MPNHDNFGLAVIIFKLLMIGRHPYMGIYKGSGDLGLDDLIKQHKYAYGKSAALSHMQRPPKIMPVTNLSPPIADLFERAFAVSSVGGGRPTAREWVGALNSLEATLRKCTVSPAHYYPPGLISCPWCAFEADTRHTLFEPYVSVQPVMGLMGFDPDLIWKQILTISDPGLAPQPLSPSQVHVSGISPSAAPIKELKWKRRLLFLVIFLASMALISIAYKYTIFIIPAALFLGWLGARNLAWDDMSRKIRDRRQQAFSAYGRVEDEWKKLASNDDFLRKRNEVEEAIRNIKRIPELRKQRLAELEKDKIELQRNRFLDNHEIAKAKISRIGPSKKSALLSYGIETALDVNWNDVIRVPGFGQAMTQSMVDWRKSIERRFRPQPNQPINPKDVQAMDQQLAVEKQKFEMIIKSGPGELATIRLRILSKREALRLPLENAAREAAQAAHDASFI